MREGRHFGTRLREARLGAGFSQSELEELSGIPKARLSRYENGHVEPSIQTLARLSRRRCFPTIGTNKKRSSRSSRTAG